MSQGLNAPSENSRLNFSLLFILICNSIMTSPQLSSESVLFINSTRHNFFFIFSGSQLNNFFRSLLQFQFVWSYESNFHISIRLVALQIKLNKARLNAQFENVMQKKWEARMSSSCGGNMRRQPLAILH